MDWKQQLDILRDMAHHRTEEWHICAQENKKFGPQKELIPPSWPVD